MNSIVEVWSCSDSVHFLDMRLDTRWIKALSALVHHLKGHFVKAVKCRKVTKSVQIPPTSTWTHKTFYFAFTIAREVSLIQLSALRPLHCCRHTHLEFKPGNGGVGSCFPPWPCDLYIIVTGGCWRRQSNNQTIRGTHGRRNIDCDQQFYFLARTTLYFIR